MGEDKILFEIGREEDFRNTIDEICKTQNQVLRLFVCNRKIDKNDKLVLNPYLKCVICEKGNLFESTLRSELEQKSQNRICINCSKS